MAQTPTETVSKVHQPAETTARNATEAYERDYLNPDSPAPGWASGVKPLRGPVDQELQRSSHTPTTEVVEWLARYERMSYEEQTTGPGLDEIPDESEVKPNKKPRNLGQKVRHLSAEILHMPHPKHEWATYILHHSFKVPVTKLGQANFLVKTGEVQIYEEKKSTTTNIWCVDPEAYRRALVDLQNRSVFPCGHGGLRNHGDGEYSCAEDACAATYPRSTAEDVFRGEDE